jgi:hypothetical protein
MSKVTSKGIVAAAAALVLSLTMFAMAQTSTVTLDINATPEIAAPGDTVTATSSVKNVSDRTQSVTIVYDLSGPCDEVYSYSVKLTLKPGEVVNQSRTYVVPNCPGGVYTLTATASSKSTVLATDTATLTVQAQ